ncbi:peptidoglycan editing factor PgeF [Rhodoferax sp.]|uniref:peptidoglycan editing factor PgeF n=1 Tax=Rhodoferax sp. TaxID=50421 RepID=UPI0019F51E07|nr:peptidoglycan editing factor PgeF [Rhodoferax sp.]MBE0474553.1 peptidoglycan editing factor PgeF [Rhodoferax sp.]
MLIPDWPAPAGVHAMCSTRTGGVSAAPFDSLNLGDHVGDDPAHVAANRAIFQEVIGAKPVFLNQVHGSQVVTLDASTPDGTVADGCLSDRPGLACTVMVADCLPVLFASADGRRVAAAHAGWRGLAGQGGVGILETTVERVRTKNRQVNAGQTVEIIAWLGPCIGPTAFEVGEEVHAAFTASDPLAGDCFTPLVAGKWLADLAELARLRLHALGISQIYGNDSSAAWCTVGNASRFFSYRRDRVTGRFCASIWREG